MEKFLEQLKTSEGTVLLALLASSSIKYLAQTCSRLARDRMFQLVGHVGELVIYPIKSCGGVEVQSAVASVTGLSTNGYNDRRWMIQTVEGKLLTMKLEPRLTLIRCTVVGDWLTVTAPNMEPLVIPVNPDPNVNKVRKAARIHGPTIEVVDCGEKAHAWMSQYLGKDVCLVHSRPGIALRDAYTMPFTWETSSRQGDKTVFAYLTSYLLTSTSSLAELNDRLEDKITSRNFRPNIVVKTNGAPFDEDNWEEVRIGKNVRFHYVMPCRRCPMTTIDPETAEFNSKNEPLATLRKFRQVRPYGMSPLFGAYIAIDCCGPVKIGDPVYAIRKS